MDENRSMGKLFIHNILATFVPSILVFSLVGWVLSQISGEAAFNDIQTIYGRDGLTYHSIAQIFALSVILGALNTVFLSEIFLKKIMLLWRYVMFIFISLVVLYIFAVVFKWLPTDLWIAWVMMPVCFVVFFLLSSAPFIIATRLKDRRYEKLFSEYKTKNTIGGENAK